MKGRKHIWGTLNGAIRNIFQWGYRNKGSIANVINVLAQIGTLVAAIVALFALKEAMFQRESTYKPDLRIGESVFCADITNIDDIVIYNIDQGTIDLSKANKDAWFRVNNIGMGTATSVSIKAFIDRGSISPLLASGKTEFDEDNPNSDIWDTLRNRKDILILPNGEVTRRWSVDYIMPISQGDENCIQYFSRTGFKTLIKTFLWLKNAGQFEDSRDFLIPIELKYKDINEKQYTKECDMLIRLSFVENNPTKIVCQIKSGQPYKEEYEEFKKDVDEEDIISVYKIN